MKKDLAVRRVFWVAGVCCLAFAEASPITDQDMDNIRQFAAAAMAKGRQLLRPILPQPPADSQGAFSHYYGRHIPPSVNLLQTGPPKSEQFFKVHAAAAEANPVVIPPAPPGASPTASASTNNVATTTAQEQQGQQHQQQPLPVPPNPLSPDPFQTFEQHMFGPSPAQPPRSQFNHHSFGPFHFFTNKSPPPPPRGPLPPSHIRHNQQLQSVMAGQHFATVVQQTRLRDQQQAQLNGGFLPFGFGGKPTQYFGKGKLPHPLNIFQRPFGGNFISQNRPNDDLALIQPHLQPQDYTFSQIPGVKGPLTVGPESNPFNLPIRFEQVQQMPYAFPVQSQPLHLAMVVQSQEFPQYQFNPNFVDPTSLLTTTTTPSSASEEQQSNNGNREETPSSTPATFGNGGEKTGSGTGRGRVRGGSSSGGSEATQKVSDSGEAVGEVIFESVRQTQQLQQQERDESQRNGGASQQFSSPQSSVFFQAPLVFSQELFPTARPDGAVTTSSHSPVTTGESKPSSMTAEQVAIEFFKAREVTDGDSGKPVVTPSSSTSFISSSSKSVSSSVSSAVNNAPQKVKRLRKVKITRNQQEARQRENKIKISPN